MINTKNYVLDTQHTHVGSSCLVFNVYRFTCSIYRLWFSGYGWTFIAFALNVYCYSFLCWVRNARECISWRRGEFLIFSLYVFFFDVYINRYVVPTLCRIHAFEGRLSDGGTSNNVRKTFIWLHWNEIFTQSQNWTCKGRS